MWCRFSGQRSSWMLQSDNQGTWVRDHLSSTFKTVISNSPVLVVVLVLVVIVIITNTIPALLLSFWYLNPKYFWLFYKLVDISPAWCVGSVPSFDQGKEGSAKNSTDHMWLKTVLSADGGAWVCVSRRLYINDLNECMKDFVPKTINISDFCIWVANNWKRCRIRSSTENLLQVSIIFYEAWWLLLQDPMHGTVLLTIWRMCHLWKHLYDNSTTICLRKHTVAIKYVLNSCTAPCPSTAAVICKLSVRK